jgi:hypothetical protein
MTRLRTLTTMAWFVLGLVCLPAASAQAPQPPAQAPQAAPSYSDTELKSFVTAALKVQHISESYLPKLQSAQDPEEQQQIREQATGAMEQALEDEGMTVNEYNDIMKQVQTNPQLAERVKQHLNDLQ